MQTLVVAILVASCSLYAIWMLMPSVARRALATALLKLPLPAAIATRLRKAATTSGGCGCDGCDAPASPQRKSAPQSITFHPRRPR